MLSSLWQVPSIVCLTAVLFTLGINFCIADSHENTTWITSGVNDGTEEGTTKENGIFIDEDDTPSIDIQDVEFKTQHREVKYELKAPGLGVATWKEISLVNNEVNGYAERNSQNQSTLTHFSFSLQCLWVLIYCFTLCLW